MIHCWWPSCWNADVQQQNTYDTLSFNFYGCRFWKCSRCIRVYGPKFSSGWADPAFKKPNVFQYRYTSWVLIQIDLMRETKKQSMHFPAHQMGDGSFPSILQIHNLALWHVRPTELYERSKLFPISTCSVLATLTPLICAHVIHNFGSWSLVRLRLLEN